MTPPDGKHEQNPRVADRGSKWQASKGKATLSVVVNFRIE